MLWELAHVEEYLPTEDLFSCHYFYINIVCASVSCMVMGVDVGWYTWAPLYLSFIYRSDPTRHIWVCESPHTHWLSICGNVARVQSCWVTWKIIMGGLKRCKCVAEDGVVAWESRHVYTQSYLWMLEHTTITIYSHM